MYEIIPALILGFIVGSAVAGTIVAMLLSAVYYIVYRYIFNINITAIQNLYTQQLLSTHTQLNILYQAYLNSLGFKSEVGGTILPPEDDEDEEDEPRCH